MGYIGVSLILASVVWVMVAPPPWMHPFMPPFLLTWHHAKPPPALPPSQRPKSPSPGGEATKQNGHASEPSAKEHHPRDAPPPPTLNLPEDPVEAPAPAPPKPVQDRAAMPPPPPPVIRRSSPIPAPSPVISEPEPEEQTTPKARPSAPAAPVPSFNLEEPSHSPSAALTPSATASAPGRGSMPPPPAPSSNINMMPPPPAPRGPAPPRLAAFPALDSPQRARGPVPNRGPSAGSYLGSSLAPPPTHSAKAPKPSRKVILTPGHSPLDWARISGPNADLRNLPTDTPYLKVTPSTLKKMTGRKGKDAWMALGGRVYNITPYLPYHPAGVPELLRGAGRDGTKLFGEIHPWVNYETMLSACLVGLLVEEDEGSKPSAMDEMD
ncbi:cytochrome b5-like heme steroid binding domain-containing protein [Colletotrichum tofieldiae]|uniref:Cytochrome b5-like heme steroid binding domain-containing protein n=1 Tax=Colletotrichum tofieldiae TaxID=708197 RepID=A0A166U8R4_9PEZI|nr:cytochrome b5-like heme steroid binding domain-containing protein [Colletotrichum tofieldiae]GKT65027.1 cytochrome b5-like heme steroid binding domain-containing protein [Colletotrichum tofieldiae]GKT74994.1 cytochrome b5-like heme steroid binding domain-containing protein [Colletotrichum tofieldiae]